MAEENDDPKALAIAEARGEIAVALEPLVRISKSGYRTLATSDLAAIVSAINGTVHALLNHIHGVEQPDEEPPAPPVDEKPPAPLVDEEPPAPAPPPPPPEREELF
jgi:hypothetical protein